MGPNLPKTGISIWKHHQWKVNITNEFCIFELIEVPNFSLNRKVWFIGPNLPEKDISGQKQKKWKLPLHFAYSIYSEYQISLYTNNFESWDQICQKRVFLVENRKKNIPIEFYIFQLVGVPNFTIRIQWGLISTNAIHCFRLRLWVGHVICFKFTPAFFCLTFLMDVL